MKHKTNTYEFSVKTCKKSVYSISKDDFDDLYFGMELDKFDLKKLDDKVYLEACGKGIYEFDWNSLRVTVKQQEKTYEITKIEVYDLKTDEFLCYMTFKN